MESEERNDAEEILSEFQKTHGKQSQCRQSHSNLRFHFDLCKPA